MIHFCKFLTSAIKSPKELANKPQDISTFPPFLQQTSVLNMGQNMIVMLCPGKGSEERNTDRRERERENKKISPVLKVSYWFCHMDDLELGHQTKKKKKEKESGESQSTFLCS